MYSYYFFPNDTFEVFETQILLLEENFRNASWWSLKGGDFNSKSPEWGKARLYRREIMVDEMVARNDLIVFNRGKDFTFKRGAAGSIIDLIISAPCLASRIGDWSVLKETTLSVTSAWNSAYRNRASQWMRVDAVKEGTPPGTQYNPAGTDYENISKKPGSLMSLIGLSVLGHWKTRCDGRDGKWSQHVIIQCLAGSTGKSRVRCSSGMTSWLPYLMNASQRGRNSSD